jgi:hypothetical protein
MPSDYCQYGVILNMIKVTRTEPEFATSPDVSAYDAWFRAKVEGAMASDKPGIPHDQVMGMAQAVINSHKRL